MRSRGGAGGRLLSKQRNQGIGVLPNPNRPIGSTGFSHRHRAGEVFTAWMLTRIAPMTRPLQRNG